MNDGRCDRVGRFVVGPIDAEFKPTSKLYSCEYKSDEDLQVTVIDGIEPYGCANSICFSLDGATMYFSDSY
jgi:L-arabinonolactonase